MIRLACALVASRARFVVPSYRGTGARNLDFTSTICTADFILSKLLHCLHHTLSQHFEQRCEADIPDICSMLICSHKMSNFPPNPPWVYRHQSPTLSREWPISGHCAHPILLSPPHQMLVKTPDSFKKVSKTSLCPSITFTWHLYRVFFFYWSCPKSSKCWRWQKPY